MVLPLRKGRSALTEKAHTPMISVIIPVYNVEKYVGKCLTSLAEQTYRDFEIIAVNDGSTDNSLDILRHFEAKYDFIKVIDQENCGMSQARNAGMRVARGEYIALVDSDDYVAPTYLEELYDACIDNDADISCCYYYFHYVENGFMFEYPFRCHGLLTQQQAMNKLLRDVQIQSYVWNKLYKRSLFTEYGVTFPSISFEDMATSNKLFTHANRVAVIDRPLYYYNQRPLSTLATMNANKINDYLHAVAMVRISLENNGSYKKYRRSYLALTRKAFNCACLYVFRLHRDRKCIRGCATNFSGVAHTIWDCSSDEFNPEIVLGNLSHAVAEPEKLEKDYSVR